MSKTLTLNNTRTKNTPPEIINNSADTQPKVRVMHRRVTPTPRNSASKSKIANDATNMSPPVTLVKTWIWMARDASDYQLKKLGERNIVNTFGSLQAAKDYVTPSGK
jgi:hypothetical protein